MENEIQRLIQSSFKKSWLGTMILALLFISRISFGAIVIKASNGVYTVSLAEDDPRSFTKGEKIDIRISVIPGIFDGRILQKNDNFLQFKMVDGPMNVPAGTILSLKSLSTKKWFSRKDLESQSELRTSIWLGAMYNSQATYGALLGLTWLANKNFDLEAVGFKGIHNKANANKVNILGAGLNIKYFILDKAYISGGLMYEMDQEDNPKAPGAGTGKETDTSTPVSDPADPSSSQRVMPSFHDESLLLGEAAIGLRLNSTPNIKIGKGFTVILELGCQFLVSVLSDNINDISVIDPDPITKSDTNFYGKFGMGYFF